MIDKKGNCNGKKIQESLVVAPAKAIKRHFVEKKDEGFASCDVIFASNLY